MIFSSTLSIADITKSDVSTMAVVERLAMRLAFARLAVRLMSSVQEMGSADEKICFDGYCSNNVVDAQNQKHAVPNGASFEAGQPVVAQKYQASKWFGDGRVGEHEERLH